MKQHIRLFLSPAAGAMLALLVLLMPACVTMQTDNDASAEAVATNAEMTTDAAAQLAYAAEDWQKVSELYGQLTNEQPDNGRYWYRLAVGLRYTGQFDAAAKALDEAARVVPVTYTAYERAKIAADQSMNTEAMAYLQTAVGAGLAGREMVQGNEHFAALVGEPGYEELLKQLDSNKHPCGDGKFRDFDFWLGEWQVATADGQIAGTNKISAREQDCMLLEEWTGAGGTTGTSMNFLDLAKDKWVQRWVSSGVQIYLEGGLVDGSMVLEGFIYYLQQNSQADFRGTWTLLEDGRVRQFFEQSDDEGNWSPWFEGFYTRITDAE